jgi:molecular chaperone DnaK (HSP70)
MSSVKDDNNSSVVDDTNSKGLVVGIDLGTTNTCMARIADDGSGQVIQLSSGLIKWLKYTKLMLKLPTYE